MKNSRQLYAMKEDGSSGMLPIGEEVARRMNADGFAIYWAVNEFEGARQIKNLKAINSWFVELDGEDKEAQWKKIERGPIWPSLVIESFAGFHVYFDAVDATPERYREVEERLIHHFGGDVKAKDLARVLRAPGYLHQKNPDVPYPVTVKFESRLRYRERIMLFLFDEVPKAEAIVTDLPPTVAGSHDLTTFINGLDNEMALLRLSGHWAVNYETYTFKHVSRGRKNIIVNGRPTSCFIDENKRIGATPGGPTIFTWLKYFGNDNKTIVEVLKKEFGFGL